MKTALVQEEPVVAVVSEQRGLAESFIKQLSPLGLSGVFAADGSSLKQTPYKTIVLITGYEQTKTVGSLLNLAAKLASPTICCLPHLPSIRTANNELQQHWALWEQHLQQVTAQAIEVLPTAQFVFVDGWIDQSIPILNPLFILLNSFQQGMYWHAKNPFSIVTSEEVFSQITKSVSRPTTQASIILSANQVNTPLLTNQVAALYESAYHRQTTEQSVDVEFQSILPFEIQRVEIMTDVRNFAQHVVQQLGRPSVQQPPPPTERVESESQAQRRSVAVAERIETAPPVATQAQEVVEEVSPPDVNNELERIFTKTRVKEKEQHLKKLKKTDAKARKKVGRNKLFFIIGSLSTGVSMAILLFGAIFVVTSNLAKQEFFSLQPDQLFSASQLQSSSQRFSLLEKILKPQVTLIGQFVDHPLVIESQLLVSAFDRIQSIQSSELELGGIQEKIIDTILGKRSGSIESELDEYVRLSGQTYTNAAQLQSLFAGSESPDSAEGQWVQKLNDDLANKKTTAGYLQSLAPLLPTLLGVDGTQRVYAILFLNSSELRPTGGFVQAIALLSVQNGQIVSFQTMSSYEVDRRIGGAIEPPEEIKKLLNENSWYFRDSNWDPHAPASAERAAWFVEKALSTKVNGVITLPTSSLSQILETVGPLSLTQYNESITSKNLQERLNFHAEVELSDQVKNYPSAILDALFQQITQKSNVEFASFLQQLPPLLTSGDMQMNLLNPEEQELFQPLRWSGSLVIPVCPTQFSQVTCQVDSIYQVESNIGVNRVNASVERAIRDEISFADGMVIHRRATKLSNTATTTAWPSGRYSTYVRWYVPSGSVLSSITIDGTEVGRKAITSYQDHGLTVFGTTVEVPISSESTVVIEYRRPLAQTLPYSYFFFDQRQPGTTLDSYQVVVEKPANATVVRLAPNAFIEDTQLTFEPDTSGHRLTAVQFK